MEKITKHDRNRLIGASVGFILCVVLLIYTGKLAKRQNLANVRYHQMEMKMIMEAGYAKGQMDAIKSIINIRPINDSSCVWINGGPWGTIKPVNDTVNVNILHK